MATTAALILFAAITTYAIFAGADFGAGFWDLVAGGTKRGERPREVIDHAIAPVWEANHVWLIFVWVLLWTCFPEAYASITLTLFVPLTLAAFGIVLRGASFAFRKAVFRTRDRRNFGAAFAISSVLVPYCFGAVVGGIASGRVPAGGKAGDPWDSWVNPTSVLGGVLAVCLTAYLAAFFLVRDAERLSDETMVAYFRRRATAAAVAAGVVAVVGIFVLSNDADYLFDGLTSQALPLVILSAVCGLAALVLVARAVAPWGPPGRRRRGGQPCRGLGRGAVGLPVADQPDGLAGCCAERDHHRGAGGHRSRRGPDRARVRAPLRAGPEDAAARGKRARPVRVSCSRPPGLRPTGRLSNKVARGAQLRGSAAGPAPARSAGRSTFATIQAATDAVTTPTSEMPTSISANAIRRPSRLTGTGRRIRPS